MRLIHLGGRVYDPKLGRFLSADPVLGELGDPQSLNPYSYVANNPLAYSDPSGFVKCDNGLRCDDPEMQRVLEEIRDGFETLDERWGLTVRYWLNRSGWRIPSFQDYLPPGSGDPPTSTPEPRPDAPTPPLVDVDRGIRLDRYDNVVSEVTDSERLRQLRENVTVARNDVIEGIRRGEVELLPLPTDVVLDPRVIGRFDVFGYLEGWLGGQTSRGVSGSRIFVSAYGAATRQAAYEVIGHELLHQKYGRSSEAVIERLDDQFRHHRTLGR